MTTTPNWWPKLMRAAKAHGLAPGSAVALAEILHDDGCARLEETGMCDCDPEVRLTPRDRQTAVGGERWG